MTRQPGATIYTPYRRRLTADEREQGREREIPEGHDLCHTCFQPFDESDLWRAGGDGEPTCTKCVRNRDGEWKLLRMLARNAAAILSTPDKSPTARSLSARISTLLDG